MHLWDEYSIARTHTPMLCLCVLFSKWHQWWQVWVLGCPYANPVIFSLLSLAVLSLYPLYPLRFLDLNLQSKWFLFSAIFHIQLADKIADFTFVVALPFLPLLYSTDIIFPGFLSFQLLSTIKCQKLIIQI